MCSECAFRWGFESDFSTPTFANILYNKDCKRGGGICLLFLPSDFAFKCAQNVLSDGDLRVIFQPPLLQIYYIIKIAKEGVGFAFCFCLLILLLNVLQNVLSDGDFESDFSTPTFANILYNKDCKRGGGACRLFWLSNHRA
jgi:hypothetical protein